MSALASGLARFWAGLRTLLGDDAYERYLRHCQRHHPGRATLGRAAFYDAELERRWRQVNRCC